MGQIMALTINRLSATKVQKLKAPGLYPDGAGLYLQVTSGNAKSWLLRYSLRGRPREMGLGSLRKVSLADARKKTAECHKLLEEHIDPIEHRTAARAKSALANTKTVTFKEAADAYIAAHRAGWKNLKHAWQWPATLEAYAFPEIGKIAVSDIDTALVLKVLQPIWESKPETANRLRGRIEQVLDSAKALNQRSGENPARWKGNLSRLLPPRSKVRKIKHHAALPYGKMPAFLKALRTQKGSAARALEFTIMTAARTGEVLGARRQEINTSERMWTIPAERMKAGKEHRVPLSANALQLFNSTDAVDAADFVFSGRQPGKPLSNMAMLTLLGRMGHGDLTVHGFRSTFRDWAAERTNFPNEVVEMALAHVIDDKTEAAYRRGELLDKRRKLMDAWANYCSSKPEAPDSKNVVLFQTV
jgi:integrase